MIKLHFLWMCPASEWLWCIGKSELSKNVSGDASVTARTELIPQDPRRVPFSLASCQYSLLADTQSNCTKLISWANQKEQARKNKDQVFVWVFATFVWVFATFTKRQNISNFITIQTNLDILFNYYYCSYIYFSTSIWHFFKSCLLRHFLAHTL